MFTILITIHVLVSFGLIISVLMQSSKGEGLAGAFGGGGGVSGAVFGGRGAAPFLSKATTALAIMFMGMCLLLTLTTGGGRSSEAVAGGSSAVQDYARDQAGQVTPTDVPEVNVGQPMEGQPQQDLPITVTPTPTGQTDQGQQKEKPPEGSGGE
ncbi:MAG: preprotein translocase subunit SecG [candidate division Zixibacteria bacterium]|nr:preprotein translocase subunit SecG [candidate division Zixibacteria bacterium]MBU1469483.1 preprotein translocase subunit SecG [candidate division Zixibacteria bacterium]MBU2624237.1 preprotein translocase subunit SecG [candidate division Zixibacteria bacterium]